MLVCLLSVGRRAALDCTGPCHHLHDHQPRGQSGASRRPDCRQLRGAYQPPRSHYGAPAGPRKGGGSGVGLLPCGRLYGHLTSTCCSVCEARRVHEQPDNLAAPQACKRENGSPVYRTPPDQPSGVLSCLCMRGRATHTQWISPCSVVVLPCPCWQPTVTTMETATTGSSRRMRRSHGQRGSLHRQLQRHQPHFRHRLRCATIESPAPCTLVQAVHSRGHLR